MNSFSSTGTFTTQILAIKNKYVLCAQVAVNLRFVQLGMSVYLERKYRVLFNVHRLQHIIGLFCLV